MQTSFPSAYDAPALVAYKGAYSLLTEDGEVLHLSAQDVRQNLQNMPCPLVIHAPALARRLDLPPPGHQHRGWIY